MGKRKAVDLADLFVGGTAIIVCVYGIALFVCQLYLMARGVFTFHEYGIIPCLGLAIFMVGMVLLGAVTDDTW